MVDPTAQLRQTSEIPAARHGPSIQLRLLLLVIAAALPALLFSVYQARTTSAVERDNAEQRALQLARRIATRVDDHVNTVDALLVSLTRTVRTDEAGEAHNDSLLASISRDLGTRFLNLSVASADGWVVGLSNAIGSRARHISVSDRDYFREAIARRGLGIGKPMIGRVSHEYSIALGRAILDRDGKPIGTVAASTLLDQLQDILIPSDLPRGAVVTLTDADGTVLARTEDADAWIGHDISTLATMRRAHGSAEGVMEMTGADSVTRLSGYATASRVPWQVFVGIPSDIALERVREQERTALVLGIASLMVSLLLAWLLARGISGPVHALTADADAFAAGDLSRRTTVRADGELGVLAHTFDRMADALERRSDQLTASEERYRSLFDTLPLPMWVVDRESLRFLAVNEAAVGRYGYSREELLAMTVLDIRLPEHHQHVREMMATDRERTLRGKLARHVTRSGEELEVEISSDDFNYGGRRARLVVANDVTERRRTEQALLASQEQLRQAQKMEAVGSLAGGIAHDFNNLLTAILGYCDLALEGIPTDSTASDDVAEVRRAAQRAAELTHQLLAFSRRQVLKPRVFSLGTALEQTEKILRRLISENIALELSVCPPQALVCADPTQVEQVILNLAVNARDAMPRGGRLRLSTGTITFDATHTVAGASLPAGTYAMLAVSDTGTGIAPEIRDRLFEPFFTTKPRGQGTGLGLATVYGIMQQSGGGIEVASVPDNGTTFILYFPIAMEDSAPDPVAAMHRDIQQRGEGTILLAEDDDAVRAIARETLERAGYRVLAAADGSQALALAGSHDGPIDLLLTDVIMPGMNGRELAATLTRRRPGLRVLYASGYTDNMLEGQGALTPGVTLLDKPFTPADLAAKVRDVLAGAHAA
ncbi:MAG TPA: PAS domain S-box protein [Gemmatimonadaceae bacterium]|nr:PAS domain S-box protein [Gemmatimonadaceae bacterium]